MNSTLRDAQAPSHRECLLPSVARTPSVTQITPAKKITFLKRGDPRFAGVRLAVDQRAFKSFGALMDELSQRMPLSFGVRSVTTPRGLHGLSALEQLEDGGCYLCSDKKPPKTPSGPGWPQGGTSSAQQSREFESRGEAPGTSSSCKGPKVPRRIMLIKNGDPRFQKTVVLSHRNTRNLTAFLSKASDLLHFPVKQVYTTSGEKVDSWNGLLHSPSVLVCAGYESFKPLAMEDSRRYGIETLSGQTSRNKTGSWGPKAKQSVIHSRSRSGSRPRRFSLLSERSGLSDPPVSLHHAQMGPPSERYPQDTPTQLGPLVASDDVEKKVHMNEDGSLSVEMKVRFHLLGEDALLWSRRVGRASVLTGANGEVPVLGEVDPLHCVCESHPGGSSEPGAQGLGTCEAGCEKALGRGRWKPGSRYEIWMNPLYSAQEEGTASQRRSRLTQHSYSRRPWSQGVTGRKRSRKDSVSPDSSDRPPKDSEPNSSCCSRSLEGSVDSCDLHAASGAASQREAGREAGNMCRTSKDPGPQGTGQDREHHRRLKQRSGGTASATCESSGSAASHEESSEMGEQHQGCLSKTSVMTTSRPKATQRKGPSLPTVSPSSLRNKDSQAEESRQGSRCPQTRGRSGMGSPLVSDQSGSGDTAESCSLPSACASVPGRRKQKGRSRAVSSPSISSHSRGARIGHPRQHPNRRDIHCPLDSAVPRQVPGPSSGGRACPDNPAPHLSGSSPSARNQASWDAGPPSSASLHSQDVQGISSALMTPVSNSDCTSNFYPPYSPSAETEGHSELRARSPAPSPSNTSDPLSIQADGLDKKAGNDLPKPSWPLVPPVGEPEGGMPGAHRDCCCSPISTPLFHETPSDNTKTLQTSQPSGSQGPSSEVSLVCSRYCPTPPRTWPFVKKHPSGSSSLGADWGPEGRKLEEEKLDARPPRPPGSQSGAMGKAVKALRKGSSSCGPRSGRMLQGKVAGGGESLEEQEEDGRMMLGALPRASPDAVVREWLSNIPEEPIPMKCETVDESTVVVGGDPEGPKEDNADKHSQEGLGEPVLARQLSHEGATSEKAESDGALPVTSDAHSKSGEGHPCSRVSEVPRETGSGKGTAVDCGVGQCVLPHKVSASIQIMKVLMGSKQGRPSSLPEVSSAVGRRLSHSARALITCLAGLHFFDEDLRSPTDKVRFTESPRYQELLSTFQALWPGCGYRQGELDSGLWELGWCKALPGLRSHVMTEDFTPTSSSGVDVGSGSGGSGEGSGPCVMDSALVPERIELPLKIPSQRPDSRTSKNQEDPEKQQSSVSTASSNSQEWACATRKDKAERNSGEQVLGSNLDQVVENAMQEEGVQLEKVEEEKEIAELPREGVQGSPEEGRVMGQELSEADSDDGEGAQEDKSVQEEEAGEDPVSTTLCPPGTREKPPEPPRSPSRRDPDASESHSGPNNEPGLEKPPQTTETSHEQTQTKFLQGPGEKSSSTACRVSLDPDILWVTKLLKRMEKAFMADLARATAEIRARWSLQSNDLLDQMVAELQQDVGQRLQDSTEKELHKIQSRAAGRMPGPAREALRWEMSLQTEQRRRRLRDLRNLSAFSEQARSQGLLSFPVEDVPTLHGALGTWLVGEPEGEEFCPCEACMRKKVIPTSPKDTKGVTSAPIKKAFDLQHILQKKKGGCANGEAAETVPEKREMELLQGDASGIGTIDNGGLELGLGQDPGTEEGGEDESSQSLGRDGDPQVGEEGEVAQNGEEKTDPGQGSVFEGVGREEQGFGEKDENTEKGSRTEGSLEGEAWGEGDQSPEGQNDGAVTTEGDRKLESGGGDQGEKEGSSQVVWVQGQQGETSGNSSPDQEGKPAMLPTPDGDTPCQRSGWKAGLAASSTFSLGNCSQLSQKGSEEKPSNGDMRSIEDESKGIPSPERKVTGMYPESSTSEQEVAPLGPRTPEQEVGEASGLEAENVVESLSFTEMRSKNLTKDKTDGFGRDDLDF
ncbi:retinitis pigmentosa 1-like 1 protein isoform X1 [Felis catus]|nr:retinitis pigmentosa 1-like 1 protein isoform X1 [Felis catus]XP_019684216.2 retinitis pigmentosa 1-like 1 protein isoform X1 [Felis catus]XP_019684219.2 retinitis pigmentosa 1-like 1 protein isoform X1 [Felis catus]XP_019684222.2 retinitis pigmentosa 1-like 1 protein isoform X1 [Felis catus]XP_044911577.1 retinitis pigmentosa 1-like 1 protein isoform X1 [Felis catus]XP_044911578.1 retinitis pigmentosa 1-like 1 protein isoform X1 [Felis catus]XP_044911579.1 retinitis pigmentosa 1-like 1 pr